MKQTFTKLGGALFFLLFLVTSSAQATVTATWDFGNLNPSALSSVNIQYNSNPNTTYIASTNSNISMYVDASNSGKLQYNNKGYAQMNAGTLIHIPVVSTKDVITIVSYANSTNLTIDGVNVTGTPAEYNVTKTDVDRGYVILGASATTYPQSITAELAYLPPTSLVVTATWDWKSNIPSGIQGVSYNGSKGTIDSNVAGKSLAVDATASGAKLAYNGSNSAQFNSGTIINVPVSSIYDAVIVTSHPGCHNYTINSVAATTDVTVHDVTADEATAGFVQIVSTGTSYLCSIVLQQDYYRDYFTTATIGSTGWATFSNTSATDFTNLAGVVDAYQVTGNTGSAITKAEVTTAAANTGLLLNAAAGTYAIPLATTGTDLSATNKLIAVASSTPVGAASAGNTNFVLVGGSGTASFKKITGDNSATVGAGKAYLQLAGDSFAPQLFFDDDVTAINKVETKKVEDGVFYTLAGQQVAQPTKGLYIVNGKKVVIK